MADLSTKSDPLHLREERPDYVEDKVGQGDDDGVDRSETVPPAIDGTFLDQGSLGVDKPTVSLDPDKVAQAEREGKGFAADD